MSYVGHFFDVDLTFDEMAELLDEYVDLGLISQRIKLNLLMTYKDILIKNDS